MCANSQVDFEAAGASACLRDRLVAGPTLAVVEQIGARALSVTPPGAAAPHQIVAASASVGHGSISSRIGGWRMRPVGSWGRSSPCL